MAAKTKKTTRATSRDDTSSGAAFPYCTAPKSLRRFLEMVPQKPRPPKVTGSTLKVWGLKSGNDQSILRVLKSLGLLGASGETTQSYADFMRKETGPAVLGRKIKSVYSSLFENVTDPKNASTDELLSFFNIHSGGSEATIRYQIDTFKALAAYATFGQSDPLEQPDAGVVAEGPNGQVRKATTGSGEPAIRIDLHIHLPENKSKSDYDAIIESIANHLYKRAP
jgi:hypothetical protein